MKKKMMNTHDLNVGQRETPRYFLQALPTVIEKNTPHKSWTFDTSHCTRLYANIQECSFADGK